MAGKDVMKFGAYKYLATLALKAPEDCHSAAMAHLFLLLQWNLLARSISVAVLCLNHFDWQGDSLGISFAMHKGDPAGTRSNYQRHVFANPFEPAICPILSLAIWVFIAPAFVGRAAEDAQNPLLFGKLNVEDNFSKWLTRLVKNENIAERLTEIGMDSSKIGTHSNRYTNPFSTSNIITFHGFFHVSEHRKGGRTFAGSQIGGPDSDQINQRGGWSIGVLDRYCVPVRARFKCKRGYVCGWSENQ